jgi:hypothetical protein
MGLMSIRIEKKEFCSLCSPLCEDTTFEQEEGPRQNSTMLEL